MANTITVRQLTREFKRISKLLPVIITDNGKDKYILKAVSDSKEALTIDSDGFNGNIGYIYLLKVNDFYKIGRTNQFEKRIKQYELHNPYKIEVVLKKKVNACEGVETHLLNRFEDKQVRGEWFKLSSSDIEEMKSFLDGKSIKPSKVSDGLSDKDIQRIFKAPKFCPKHQGMKIGDGYSCGCKI